MRPLTKAEALRRGERAGDCSSSTVPFRCLSPHTYYGVCDGVPQRGYLLFEAWLAPEEPPAPTLVLETINIPIPLFDFVQDDLVHIIEAIAHQRVSRPDRRGAGVVGLEPATATWCGIPGWRAAA